MTEVYEWNERLFGCFDDLLICCCGFWCTSCLFGYNASKLDGKNGCVMCCIHYCLAQSSLCWVAQYFQRQKMRQRYGLKEDERCNDLAASFCCSSCALCQETREMKSRGFLEGKTHFEPNGNGQKVYASQPASAPNPYGSYEKQGMSSKPDRL